MKTTDLFKINRTASKLNESLAKTFGKKLNLESFDLPQLEDARNKLRTQVYTARSQANFNETVENEALTQAQWMLDTINAAIAERQELIADAHTAEIETEGFDEPYQGETETVWIGDDGEEVDGVLYYTATMDPESGKISVKLTGGDVTGYNASAKVDDNMIDYLINDPDYYREYMQDALEDAKEQFAKRDQESVQVFNDEEAESLDELQQSTLQSYAQKALDDENYKKRKNRPADVVRALRKIHAKQTGMSEDLDEGSIAKPQKDLKKHSATAKRMAMQKKADKDHESWLDQLEKTDPTHPSLKYRKQSQVDEVAPPGAKAERMVKHIKKGYAKDGKLSDKERSIAYATAWKQHNKNESVEGDNMATLREGEVQQAQSIVTAKTMVDRVGRWIEELSGMENDTLLQLGDQIRDEQGQEAAKTFISSVAPAIQQALENLKATRESLASGVRTLTGEEQPEAMLGSDPEAAPVDDFGGEAEPDAMNPEVPMDDEVPADDFAAAEPAAGGVGDAGRMKRESIDRSNSLLKVLAG
jgi:hypothetical protein